jgi:hypothetical protein
MQLIASFILTFVLIQPIKKSNAAPFSHGIDMADKPIFPPVRQNLLPFLRAR